jgi:two-component system sensor histidine kinase UhpB
MTLNQLESLIKSNAEASELLTRANSLLSGVYESIRDIIKNTRVEIIDSVGLTMALESWVSQCQLIADKPTIEFTHNLPTRPDLSYERAVSFYKVVREAVLNAIKHAKANDVTIYVEWREKTGEYFVVIADDGIGISASIGDGTSTGVGLIDIRERVRTLGGRVVIEPATPSNKRRQGTKISFTFS